VANEASENNVTGRLATPGSFYAVDRWMPSPAPSDEATDAKTAATSTSHDSRVKTQWG